MKHISSCLLCLALSLPAQGQTMDFQQLLSGKDFPFTIKLKDLNTDWRRMSIGSTEGSKGGLGDMMSQLMQLGAMSAAGKGQDKNDAGAAMLGMSLLSSLFGGGGGSHEPVYYTKGQTVTVAGETFLVAYRYEKPQPNLMQLAVESQKNGGKEPDFSKMAGDSKLTPDSSLALVLVNTKTIGTLSSIRPFDMNQEIADSAAGGGGLMDLIAGAAANEKAQQKPTAELRVNTGESVGDITPAIKTALAADSQLKGPHNKVTVTSADAVVILRGHVATAALKARAAHIANQAIKDTGGGHTLRNQLVVGSK